MSIKLGVRYEGNGYFRTVSRHALEEAEGKFKKGEVLNAELRRPRSVGQNNLFHALCEVAFDNRRDGPELETWRHLKSWLLIRAGECTEERFEPGALTPKVARALRKRFDFVEFAKDAKTGEIIMRFANSTAFDKMDSERFSAAFNKSVEIICEEIVPGTTAEEMLEMAKKGTA